MEILGSFTLVATLSGLLLIFLLFKRGIAGKRYLIGATRLIMFAAMSAAIVATIETSKLSYLSLALVTVSLTALISIILLRVASAA